MAFHEVQFPTDISFGSIGGPEFSTNIIELSSGHERRNINWTYPRERWNVAYGVKELVHLQSLLTFFYVRQGRAHGFRFKNHDDFQASGMELGIGDGSETEFQLIKTYTSGGYTLNRKITKPVSGEVTVYVDSYEIDSGIAIDTTTGIITFDTAPDVDAIVYADFDFDIPVRFDTDHLPVQLASYQAGATDVTILELKI